MRFKKEDISEVEAKSDMLYVIETKDGTIWKLRKSQMEKDELDAVVGFFLQ